LGPEEQLPETGELRQTALAGCYPLRIELGVHRAHEGARLRGLPHAQLLPSSGPPLRLARRLQAERLGASRRGAIRAPRRDVLARRAPAPGARESHAAEDRRARRRSARHGTKSCGSRASEVRNTRMLARPFSSSARYASRAAVASPPCSTMASWIVGARPSWRYGAVSARPHSGLVRKTRAGIVPCAAGV